ncbi:dihydrofolate reductase [Pandoravirus inopinatum]|uniref:Dihydrofolate reductase n=1 Tax=Pandoravirus inopinatum TaxID=1605721 RepID=A0A0B5J1U4_9VIRU|nr:dihydrofolate reductase [Pandoravirus inopinatum]AJF97519.1 dihydrofolate reductase [Pandoravirus inopinatum]
MEPQSTDTTNAATTPSTGRTEVHLIAAVDQNGLVSSGGRLPWEFKASGQIKEIADEVANHTVVVGHHAAIALGGKPPGLQIIVLTSAPPQRRYSRTRRTLVERRVQGLWKGCEVARSVDEVFARCTADRLYVIGGRKTFELFLPFATTVTCHVLQRALFADAPPSPSNLYFPPMVREATLVDVRSTTVDSHLATKREEWRLDPVTLPPTRAEAAARVKAASQVLAQTPVQPAPAPVVRTRPVATVATTRASWFQTTPVGAAVAKKVPPFQPAPVVQSTAKTTLGDARVALAPAASDESNDEALREAIQASLIEMGIVSEMAAMQQHYKVRARLFNCFLCLVCPANC